MNDWCPLYKRPIQLGITTMIVAVLVASPHIASGQFTSASPHVASGQSTSASPHVTTGQSTSVVQQVSVKVAPIVVMAVFGEPRPFIIDSVEEQTALSDESTYYNLTTNVDGVIISAEIDFPMPEGTQLFLSGESTLGSSRGPIDISSATTAREIISSIDHGLENGQRFRYELRVTDGAGEIHLQSRSVTLSLLNPANGLVSQIAQTVFFGATLEDVSVGDR